jgi:hypothetical protein
MGIWLAPKFIRKTLPMSVKLTCSGDFKRLQLTVLKWDILRIQVRRRFQELSYIRTA